jgi:hypothetical protein
MVLRDLLSAIAAVADEVWALCDAIAPVDDLRVTRNLIAVVGQKAGELVRLVRRKESTAARRPNVASGFILDGR